MRVVCYAPGYDPKHRTVLEAFAEGARAEVRDLEAYEPCDVAVIFGVVKRAYKATWPKARILERHAGRRLIVIESGFVRRGEYWQVGWGGFAGHADFRNADMPPDRWRGFGIRSQPWSDRPDAEVVVCGQVPHDTQVQDTDHIAWCRRAIETCSRFGYRVRFRPHPKVADPAVYAVPQALWDRGPLADTLARARCFVTWNSTAGVDAAIAGVPVVACDPGAMAWPISAHGLDSVRRLRHPSRRAWLAGLGYAQWSLEEMRAGLPWRHLMRP